MDLNKLLAAHKPCSFHDHEDTKNKTSHNRFGKRRNCDDNPLCFYGLGEHKTKSGGIWGPYGHLKSLQLLQQQLQPQQQQGGRRDAATQPAGFPNLGATCYMNSLLQTLFHNDQFRQLVYEYRNAADLVTSSAHDNDNGGSSLSKRERQEHAVALQRLFCQLELSTAGSIDPSSFVHLLKLETQIQQDAQEFNKLLLDHLAQVMDSPRLLEMFQGELKYTNKCLVCHTESGNTAPFLELELALKNEHDIASCLETFCRPESLQGDNQYHCEQCATRVDAERRVQISKLPPILNLQLMRFVFDPATLAKRKTKETINIPEELQLGGDGGQCYDLKAVLFHKGQSADSGHYVCEILCGDGQWWVFNDSAVELRHQASKRGSGTKNSSSGDAYMVVYHLRGKEKAEAETVAGGLYPNLHCADVAPQEQVHAVLQANEQVERDRAFFNEQRTRVELAGEQRKQLYDEVFLSPELDVAGAVPTERVWVPTVWLQSWISGEPQPTAGELFHDSKIDYPVCRHGLLDLSRARHAMKLVPRPVWASLGIANEPPHLCQQCARSACETELSLHSRMDDWKRFDDLLAAPTPAAAGGAGDGSVWISRDWVKQRRESIKRRMQELREELALPRKRARTGSMVGGDDLDGGGGDGDVTIVEDKVLPPCTVDLTQTAAQDGGDGDGGGDINADIVCEHKHLLPNTKSARRLLAKRDWDALLTLLPITNSNHTLLPESVAQAAPCEQCALARAQAAEWLQADRALVERDAEFGPVLRRLLARTCGYPSEDSSSRVWVPVPRLFLDEFRDYLQVGRWEEEDGAPLSKVNFSALNCPHGQLVLNPHAHGFLKRTASAAEFPPPSSSSSYLPSAAESSSSSSGDGNEFNTYGVEVEFVSLAEWGAIDRVMAHAPLDRPATPPVTVEFLQQHNALLCCSPNLCLECCDVLVQQIEDGKHTYTNRTVFLNYIKLPATSAAAPAPAATSSSSSSRASSSKLQPPAKVALMVNSSDTVLQLKRKLWEACRVNARRAPPFDAHQFQLYRCGGEPWDAERDEWTLAALAVCAGDDLHYEYDADQFGRAALLLQLGGDSSSASAERGFQGTALLSSFTPSPVPFAAAATVVAAAPPPPVSSSSSSSEAITIVSDGED